MKKYDPNPDVNELLIYSGSGERELNKLRAKYQNLPDLEPEFIKNSMEFYKTVWSVRIFSFIFGCVLGFGILVILSILEVL